MEILKAIGMELDVVKMFKVSVSTAWSIKATHPYTSS